MDLQGKKALITGASRGIGKAIALAYAKAGADVAITGRKIETLKPVIEEIQALGSKAVAIEWDVADVKKVNKKIANTAEKLGGLDIVVNNAGVLKKSGCKGVLNITEEDWDYVMNPNLKGLYFTCQAAANYMINHEIKGTIINISSESGLAPFGTAAPYGISKAGVVNVTKGLARFLLPKGILVNGIAPGCVSTEMLNCKPGQLVESGPPYGRMNYPEEIADVAVFLASSKGARVAGDTIVVGGGLK